ncbi:cyclin-J18-like [Pyrus x bretschneideri]|uniref:cyclin-J18-like n=1 Tax=Pyrus x bretschneideri TaxID=225117 RepID=UPI00202E1C3D|nr:cyclin-J18-like [Pyrus x bretschneideri]
MSQEVVLMQEVNFEIGMNNIAFVHFEELLLQLKGVAKDGELVNFEAGMDIMDLLYEKEETSMLYTNPRSLAASILVASYIITVPKQMLEFPVLPWGKISSFLTLFSFVMLLIELIPFNCS